MGDTSNVSDAVKVTDADVRAAAPQLAAAAEQAQKIKSGATPSANPTGAAVNFGSSTGNANAANAQTQNPTGGAQVSGNANAAVTNPASQQASGSANAANGTVSGNANAAYPNGYQGGYGSYSTTGAGATPTDVNYNNQISKTIAELETLYRDLYGRQRDGDYTRAPYYQTIIDQYGIAGDNAANAERAAAAGNNGGNLDSYAAANARRQQLSYRNAAQTAALNAYNAEIGNMLQTLQQLGVNVNDLYGTWSGDLASQRSGANAAYGYDTQRYLSDNDYRAALAGYDRDRYLSNNDLTGTIYKSNTDRYKSDNELLSDRYLSDNDLAGKMYGYDTNYDIAALQDATNRYGIDVNYLTSVLGYNTQAAIAQMDADAQMRVAQYQNLLGMYQADIQREIAQGNNASEERINAATLAYNQTRDALNNELQRYLGGLDYQASIANANASVDAARAKAGTNGTSDAMIDWMYDSIFGGNGAATNGGNAVVGGNALRTENPASYNMDPNDAARILPYVNELYGIATQSNAGTTGGDYARYIQTLRDRGMADNVIDYIVDAVNDRIAREVRPGGSLTSEGESPNHYRMGDATNATTGTTPAVSSNELTQQERDDAVQYIDSAIDILTRYGVGSNQYIEYINSLNRSGMRPVMLRYIFQEAEKSIPVTRTKNYVSVGEPQNTVSNQVRP